MAHARSERADNGSWIARLIRFCLEMKIVVFLFVLMVVAWGSMVAPFDWDLRGLPRDPVPVDAIPDIGENQQIVFTEWMGRSPQDVEDQITYPLTVSLLGIPGVKTIRSYSMFGFSTIYVIFKEGVDFYWSRSRVLEKLNSLPAGTLPPGVQPALGPDATALGQVFWYTLEGRDAQGRPTGGWDLDELRSVQDWYVRYALLSADGVSEVASIGGFVKEYQIDVDPDAMRAHRVTLQDVFQAVKASNVDVGARTIEVNKVEYVIRGLGFVRSLKDLEETVVAVRDRVPIRVRDVAHVTLGPALRRGALDKEGAEVVGGVVVVRYGENPLAAIKNVKRKIAEISPGLPKKTLPDGTVSQVTIVPFYDRTGLIYETLGTLNSALYEEILVTVIVILLTVMNLRSSALISGLLPLAVLMCFIAMKLFHVDANIVALSGIAIAIGTMVDMGIVICENILRHLDEAPPGTNRLEVVYGASVEVGSAVLTAVATTVVSFLPVFTMEAAEGKLFKPLAYTKTFALIASIIVALTVIPPLAHLLFREKTAARSRAGLLRSALYGLLVAAGVAAFWFLPWWGALPLVVAGGYLLAERWLPDWFSRWSSIVLNVLIVVLVALLLALEWLPLGPENGMVLNFLFVAVLVCGLLGIFFLFRVVYEPVLRWSLRHKMLFMTVPLVVTVVGFVVWLGFDAFFGWLPQGMRQSAPVKTLARVFPGLGKEFMPPLDEGSYLYMPTTMPHASIGEALDVLQKQDMAIRAIPEIDTVVGKIGRVESPLDPAPISMIETIINYKPEYLVDKAGRRLRFRFSPEKTDLFRDENGVPLPAPDGKPYTVQGKFERDDQGRLIPDEDGMPFRLWRPALDPDLNEGRDPWPGVRKPDDIWDLIVQAAQIPGTTSAPKLQPIAARIVMLQSGMRAPMGVKVKGPDLASIEKVGLQLERFLKEVPSVEPATVIADRIVGKPYLEIQIDRRAIARYGISIRRVQDVIEVAVGGKRITTTVEGRERYPVRVRYMRELRDTLESLARILVPAPDGTQIPLEELAEIRYVRGPQVIKSEDTFLVGYVVFDKKPGYAEVDVVEQAQAHLQKKLASGELELPAGVSYTFAGSYENQIRAQKKLSVVLPLALFIIFMILYFQFRSGLTTVLVFSGILLAWSGGFLTLWLYAQPWFLDFSVFGMSMRDLFSVHPVNLSVAVWVGFLALFGIASDNGVIVATYLDESFRQARIETVQDVRDATVVGAVRRVRPALMTSATTILALLPVLTSTGRGADIMVPMAIPSFGGMLLALISVLLVPVLYCAKEEAKLRWKDRRGKA
ncbi:Cu(I)/Ag(I) efflux system membrane protein CusA/SilA [Desulfacinum hydrothermale DSM 13146]|uniref:Cu(I)/Ag(I) efflux system membrane protein CusA/SilA n=1 Tax=Desulfacinum hydrothermale DSM 13146 TaxID=1121390 RepID=A0A1W1XE37_9BACT|nr:efflux RND transporter permease subunit [Desulfacinum hydrothermale]SMC22305.1 Cu(I)/Ag(I) efflux system membrane protein CusA/SilA [Desulfacinum hydrothermale DSM 13146]